MTDQPADHAAFRGALRCEKIAARLAMPAAAHRAASTRVLARLDALLASRPPAALGLCVAVRGEVDCLPLATRLHAAGWRIAMPVVEAPDTAMRFRVWQPDAPMTTDPHGIPVPAMPTCPPPDVLLLPLVAFDAAGYRLGYGGGYFDRTLAACQPRPYAIGVGFDLGALASIHPAAHDIPLDAIITESATIFHTPP